MAPSFNILRNPRMRTGRVTDNSLMPISPILWRMATCSILSLIRLKIKERTHYAPADVGGARRRVVVSILK